MHIISFTEVQGVNVKVTCISRRGTWRHPRRRNLSSLFNKNRSLFQMTLAFFIISRNNFYLLAFNFLQACHKACHCFLDKGHLYHSICYTARQEGSTLSFHSFIEILADTVTFQIPNFLCWINDIC